MRKATVAWQWACCAFFISLIFLLGSSSLSWAAETDKIVISLQDGSKILVFDPATGKFVRALTIFDPSPLGRALPPNSNDVLVVNGTIWMTVPGSQVSETGLNQIAVIDASTYRPKTFLKTGITPSGMLLHDGKIYVINRYGNTIGEFDAATAAPLRLIPFSIPKPGALNPPLFLEIDNGKIYLPFPGGFSRPGLIQVLDLKTGALLKSIDFASVSNFGPVAIKRAGKNKLYLGGLNSVAVLDSGTDTINKTISLSSSPLYIQSFAVSGNKMYAANGVSTVSVLDRTRDVFVREIDIGYHPYACHLRVGIAADTHRVFVSDAGRGLKIIDTQTDEVVASVPTEEPLGPLAAIPKKSTKE